MNKSKLLLLATALGVLTGSAFAADWPAWRGVDRTDISKETGLLKKWPANGPKLLWTFDKAGAGYAGPAIVGDVLYTMGADAKTEYVYAVDLKTQKKVWNVEIGPLFSFQEWGDGPRGTPSLDGDYLYCISGQGHVVCVEKTSGKKIWTTSLTEDLGGTLPRWGYTTSPLLDGDRVLVSPGDGGGVVAALNKKDGKVEWQCRELKDPAAYSSPIVADVAGIRQYIQVTMKGIVGVAAKDGKLLWYQPKKEFRTAVIPTPIYQNGYVYFTAGYGVGCELLKLSADGDKFKVEIVYENKNMVNHHGGVVLVGENLYGYSEGKGWVCQDFKTGKIVWSDKTLGKGSLTCADGHLYCYTEKDGTCALVEASPKGWKEDGQFKIPQETSIRRKNSKIWTHPVVANGKLYLRDQDLIFCYDVKEAK